MNKHFLRTIESARPATSRLTSSATKFLSLAALSLTCVSASAATWYVDGKYGNNAAAGSSSAPLRDVWQAWSKAKPGDTIRLKPTITYGYIYLGYKSGYEGKPITITSEKDGTYTRVSGRGKNYGIMLDHANHVVVRNLDVTAPGTGRYAAWSAIYIKKSHHVTVSHSSFHDSGCAGIQTHYSDYVTIDSNRVTGNSKIVTNNVYCSGISNHWNENSDSYTGTKMIIRNNFVSGNSNYNPNNPNQSKSNSDGSGIIIDDSRRTQIDYKAYKGGTLIENNVVFDNGGRGVHIYLSDKTTVRGNTLYNNNRDPRESGWRPGEISVVESGGTTIINNIFHSDASTGSSITGQHVSISIQDSTKGAKHYVDYNLNYNSKGNAALQIYFRNNPVGVDYGGRNRFGNPQFKVPGTDPSWADFRPTWGTAAVNFASPWWSIPSKDFLNMPRMAPVTAGAYQVPI